MHVVLDRGVLVVTADDMIMQLLLVPLPRGTSRKITSVDHCKDSKNRPLVVRYRSQDTVFRNERIKRDKSYHTRPFSTAANLREHGDLRHGLAFGSVDHFSLRYLGWGLNWWIVEAGLETRPNLKDEGARENAKGVLIGELSWVRL